MFIVKRIFLALNIIVALGLLATYIPYHVFSESIPYLTLLGYVYPFFLIVNVIFLFIWLLIGSRRFMLISIVAIIVHLNFVARFINVSSQEKNAENSLTILTYNVNAFRYDTEGIEDSRELQIKIQDNIDSIAAFVSSTKADIVVFQDFFSCSMDKSGMHNRMMNVLNYKYYYNIYKGSSYGVADCVIYSKYLIRESGRIVDDDYNNATMTWSDIATPQGDIRIYNLHLLSYQLDVDSKEAYSKIKKGDVNDKSAQKNILRKLVVKDKYRKYQVDDILQTISKTEKPYIIAGDFNTQPFSYVYKQFMENHSDAFVAKGNGIGRTYNGVFPAYRIDYVMYKSEDIKINTYESPDLDFSDHYPVVVNFSIKD